VPDISQRHTLGAHQRQVKWIAKDRVKKFVELYDGDAKETVKHLYNYPMGKMTRADRAIRLLKDKRVQKALAKKSTILSKIALKELWSELATNTKVPVRDRLAASQLLAKSKGMFIERHKVEGKISFAHFVEAAHGKGPLALKDPTVVDAEVVEPAKELENHIKPIGRPVDKKKKDPIFALAKKLDKQSLNALIEHVKAYEPGVDNEDS
jgi:hypothetical protein